VARPGRPHTPAKGRARPCENPDPPVPSVGIDLKELGESAAQIFEILPRD